MEVGICEGYTHITVIYLQTIKSGLCTKHAAELRSSTSRFFFISLKHARDRHKNR